MQEPMAQAQPPQDRWSRASGGPGVVVTLLLLLLLLLSLILSSGGVDLRQSSKA